MFLRIIRELLACFAFRLPFHEDRDDGSNDAASEWNHGHFLTDTALNAARLALVQLEDMPPSATGSTSPTALA